MTTIENPCGYPDPPLLLWRYLWLMDNRADHSNSPNRAKKGKPEGEIRKQIDEAKLYLTPKFFLGFALIVTALICAAIINTSANRSISVWRATENLAPGSIIGSQSIAATRVLLPENAEKYLSSDAQIEGAMVLRAIAVDELIPAFAVASDVDSTLMRVPISVPSSFLPYGLSSGDLVDIYAIPSSPTSIAGNPEAQSSELLIEGVGIEGVDSTSKDLGGSTTLTLLIPESVVKKFLSGLVNQQPIVVKRLV